MKTVNALAVDLGAGSGRGILGRFDGKKITLSEIHRFPNPQVNVNGSVYWDILRLYGGAAECIAKAWHTEEGRVSSVAIDGWAQDFGLLDRQGNLTGNVHTYRDPRWEGTEHIITDAIPPLEFYGITGAPPIGFMTAFQLLGARAREGALYGAAETLLFVPDLINYFLTGRKVCNATLAGISGLYDIYRREWSARVINAAGFKDMFPPICGTCEAIGPLTPFAAESAGAGRIPVTAVAAHDTMSAFAFAKGKDGGAFLISSGTWSVCGYRPDKPTAGEREFSQNYINEVGFGHEILLLKNITGLFILQELFREWGDAEPDYESLNEAAAESGYAGIIDVDAQEFSSSGGMERKITEHTMRTGQKPPATKAEYYLCVLASLARKYRETMEDMESMRGRPFDGITVVGGGARNALLTGLTSEICQRRVETGAAEASSAGSVLSQFISLGEVRAEEVYDIEIVQAG